MGGGNVVQAGATLREGDLKRNGVASVEAIYDLVYNGRGKMPGYGTGCTPKVEIASYYCQGAQVLGCLVSICPEFLVTSCDPTSMIPKGKLPF